MTAPARRAVLYARISVATEESVSIERQVQSARRYAEARGWDIVGTYIDEGVSATANRPEGRAGWGALIRAEAGAYDTVVIWKVDRLARRVLDFLHADEALQARSAALVAVEDPIDMTTAQGRAFAVMLAVFGEMEAAAIRARVVAARRHLAATGRWAGGGAPYGLMPVPGPGGVGWVLDRDPERWPWLVGIVQRAQRGDTINSIATWLRESDAPTSRSRREDDTRERWPWQTVAGIIRSPHLAGMTAYNPGRSKSGRGSGGVRRDADGQPIVDESIAILTVAEWEALQQARRDLDAQRSWPEKVETSALLRQLATCDHCDVLMVRNRNGGFPSLKCPKCRQNISRHRLDPYIVDRLLAERGHLRLRSATVAAHWAICGDDTEEQRTVLASQLASLRIRRPTKGIPGGVRYRAMIEWRSE